MARSEKITCDVCSDLKGEGNKWLLGLIVSLMHDKNRASVAWVAIRPWSNTASQADAVKHLCSDKCAQTWIQRENEILGR